MRFFIFLTLLCLNFYLVSVVWFSPMKSALVKAVVFAEAVRPEVL